jgi:Spy/CpxP family protein refolding chaperone
MTMRILTASVIIAGLALGTPAFAQTPGPSSQPESEAPAKSSTVIRSIQVVDIKNLQPSLRSKVDEIVAQTSEEDIQALRKSIDATPEAASVLKAKGFNSSQVVAINIADGVLTMFTKTA